MHRKRIPPRSFTPAQRFFFYVTPGPDDACWEWQGPLDSKKRYGRLSINYHWTQAHRLAWTVLRGPIPVGMTIDHLCFNTRCVNPNHLEIVSLSENVRRGNSSPHRDRAAVAARFRATHCKHGHEYVPGSYYTRSDGFRRCKECVRLRDARRSAARRARPA